ncbi:MAG: response regulator [Bacteroidetes bacterium]|nr:MAG: response regulator [Bacteroidota bacterium]
MYKEFTGKPEVLVVDDDEDMLIMMQHMLMAEGYVPLISPNAQNAMEIISHRNPAMILLDLRMIGIDGGDICQQIKSDPYTSSIPVIILSANHNIESIAKDCGADAYLTKPFSLQKFKEVFHQLISKKNH